MVYCGKPSKGCSGCRERKIRCDQREPGCGQCEKRQQQCPGYRNLVDLMFRDESSHVIKKAKAKARRKERGSPEPGSTPESLSGTTPGPAQSVTPEPQAQQQRRHHLRPRVGNLKKRLSVLTQASLPPTDPSSLQLNWSRDKDVDGDDDESLLPSPDAGSWPKTPMIAVLYTLNPTCQERGTAYFFSRYVAIDENAYHQRFDFIYDIWQPGALMPEHQVDSVMASMTAVGLVGLANMTSSRDAMDSARKSYGTALRLINATLKVPREAVKDTTMLSILILGLFEMTAANANPRTMKAWQEHINGAAALARLRGPTQFATRAGTKMFMMLCQSVMISCIQQELPMPIALMELRAELSRRLTMYDDGGDGGSMSSRVGGQGKFDHARATATTNTTTAGGTSNCRVDSGKDGEHPIAAEMAHETGAVEISMPLYQVLQFRHDFKSGRFGDRQAAIDRLLQMDEEFAQLVSGLPTSWRYRVLRVSRPHKAVFNGICHVYPSVARAAVWNGIRACRMLILETILAELHARFRDVAHPALVPPRYVDAFHSARLALESMCCAILASVPQHSGLLASPDYLNRSHASCTGTGTGAGQSSPISTVEVRALATPPQSPESTASSSPSTSSITFSSGSESEDAGAAADASGGNAPNVVAKVDSTTTDDSGPTLLDPTRARSPEQEAHRFMLLASASNTIVWPLYHVGMSSVCSSAMKAYCVERLEAIYKETGLSQASAIAAMVQSRGVVPRWKELYNLFPPIGSAAPK